MDNMYLEEKLAEKYREIFNVPENRPDWAVKKKKNDDKCLAPFLTH